MTDSIYLTSEFYIKAYHSIVELETNYTYAKRSTDYLLNSSYCLHNLQIAVLHSIKN